MRKTISLIIIGILAISACTGEQSGYPVAPVPFTSVKVNDSFWGGRLKASREVTIPLAFSKCEETGRYENFVKAEKQMHSDVNLGYKVEGFPFDDTDVYKTIEGASYILQTYPDPKLETYIDSVLAIVAKAQEPDGYLYTPRTMNPERPHAWSGPERWSAVEQGSHEFYNLGHMVDAAVAHYQATGKRNFLDIAIQYADCVIREIGDGPDQKCVVPGHQIAEMALARLYLATGDRRYLDQAKFFLDKRGTTEIRQTYSQSHEPVLRQTEAVGHAVRAVYMYSGMADVAALTGDEGYVHAIDAIWDNIVSKKLYITGGIGARHDGEAFGDDYELPNESAYCETCAAIGLCYVNHRMFLLHGEAKYYDVLERTLYNGLISGVSLEGNGFFYPNPLASSGDYAREPWFGCACCPSNICRFIPSLPGYIYAVKDKDLYVNLYMSNTMTHQIGGRSITLSQKTGYPWNGDIAITIDDNNAGKFGLKLRIPGWVRGEVVPSDLYSYSDGKELGYSISVNGETVDSPVEDGYFTISRHWREGDEVSIHFEMEPRTVKANDKVEADRGLVAFEKGPIVYCAEWPDNLTPISQIEVGDNETVEVMHRDDLLQGIDELLVPEKGITLIPYYAWAHRGTGEMAIWLKCRK